MTVTSFTFPVVAISGAITLAAEKPTDLTRGTRKGIRSGYFSTLVIIDSEGQRVRIAGARPKGLSNPLTFARWFVGLPVQLALLHLDTLSPIGLDEFKSLLCRQVNRDRGFWSSVAVGPDGLKTRIRASSSFRDAILLFV